MICIAPTKSAPAKKEQAGRRGEADDEVQRHSHDVARDDHADGESRGEQPEKQEEERMPVDRIHA